MKKRMGLFVFFDKDNIVDDYVLYLLDSLKEHLDGMVIISNSNLPEEQKKKLDKYCFKFIQRENYGLDAGALCEYFRNNNDYEEYDEIVYFNDTYYAPLYPFSRVFDEMDKKKCDFWGLAVGEPEVDGFHLHDTPYYPRHLQSFFMVFKKNVYMSDAFQNYWRDYDYEHMNSFWDVVNKHELTFTKYLTDHGFTYDYYLKTDLISDDYHRNFNHFAYFASDQVIHDKSIFIKRKNFAFPVDDLLYLNCNNDLKRAYYYVRDETDYDVKLIWKNVLRLYNIYDVAQALGVNEIIIPKENKKHKSVNYFIVVDNEYLIDKVLDRVKILTGNFNFYTNSDVIFEKIKKLKYTVKKYNNDLARIVMKDMNNSEGEYISFIDIKDIKKRPLAIDYTSGEVYLDNLVLNSDYVDEIISKISDENISMAYGPNTYIQDEFRGDNIWDYQDYLNVEKIIPDYKLLDIAKNPVSQKEAWIAKKGLLKYLNKEINNVDDEHFAKALTISMAYCGALDCKYPIIVSNMEYSSYLISLQNTIINKSLSAIYRNNETYGPTFAQILKNLDGQKAERGLKRTIIRGVRRRLSVVKHFLLRLIGKEKNK